MELKTDILSGKRGLIMGVANNRSIAWGIAKACSNSGAELAFTYQGEAIEKRIVPLAKELNSSNVFECDVSDSVSVDNTFNEIEKIWGKIDFVVHAIGFSDKNGRQCIRNSGHIYSDYHARMFGLVAPFSRADVCLANRQQCERSRIGRG